MTIEIEKFPKLTQERIDELGTMYRTNRSIEEGELNPDVYEIIDSTTTIINQNGELSFSLKDHKSGEETSDINHEKIVYLASVSKLAIILEFVKKAKKEGLDSIPISIDVIIDIIQRDQVFRIFERENIYEKFIEAMSLEEKEVEALKAKNNDSYVKVKAKAINRLKDHYGDSKIDFSIDEIEVLSLGLSCNEPVTVAKNYLLDKFDSIEELQKSFEEILDNAEYRITISTENGYHWVQTDANTGKLSAFLKLLHRMAEKYVDKELTPEESEVFDKMVDNPENFDFDFTHSALGQELISKGWKIVEKTGYYGSVDWVEKLAKEGYPIHMSMSTIVTLIPPDGSKPISFSHNLNTEVSFPTATEDFYGLSFPGIGITNKEYTEYILAVKAKVASQFRAECEKIVRQMLNL